MADSPLQRLQNFFGVGIKNNKIVPAKKSKKGNAPADFDPLVNKIFKEWKKLKVTPQELTDRRNLQIEMESMYMNSALISRAVNLVKAEIVNSDLNNRIISVDCPDEKIKKKLETWFDEIGLDTLLLPTAHNLVLYGDAFWVLSYEKNQISEILIADPTSVKDRIEFTPHEIQKYMNGSLGMNQYISAMNNDQKLQSLMDTISSQDGDFTSLFRSYLFGFDISDYIIPPWRCLHFRNFTSNEVFNPFGMPMFIHALYPYKQYELGLGLQVLARRARFPIDLWKVNFPTSMDPTDAVEETLSFMHQFHNSGLRDTKNEDVGIGERMFLPNNVVEYEQISPNIDIGRIDDLEMLRDDMILATGLPRNFLDPNNGSFGNSGISLIEQFKPFARIVYTYQQIILEQVTQLARIYLIQEGQDVDKIEFTLSMPYPESQNNTEIVNSQKELLGLATEVLTGFKDNYIGSEGELPREFVKDVFQTILPWDQDTLDRWVGVIKKEEEKKKAEEEAAAAAEGGDGATPAEDTGEPEFTFESIKRKIKKDPKSLLRESFFKAKSSHFGSEYSLNRRHFLSSKRKSSDFNTQFLIEWKTKKLKLLNEEFKVREEEKNE